MSNNLILACFIGLAVACSGFDDAALQGRLSEQDERLAALETQTGELRSTLESLQNTDRVTAVEPIQDQGVMLGFTVRFAKSEPLVVMLSSDSSSEGLESLEIVGDKVVFTLSDSSVISLSYDAAPVLTFAKETLFIAPGGYTEVSYTIAGGDSANSVEAVAEGYWKSEILHSGPFAGKLRISHADGCLAGKALVLVTDGSGRSCYRSVGIEPMSTEVSAKNRYSMTIYRQADGSWALGAIQYAVLEGAEPEGLYEPFDAPPLVGSSSVADVEYEEVVYKSYADRDLHMNICPAVGATEPVPVVFFTHGGGWRAGDHNSLLKVARYMAKYSGFAAVSVQYSLVGQTDTFIETSVQDIRDALTWLGAHAEEYNLDMSRVAFVGNSAGGHLSAVLAMTWPAAKVLVGWAGVYDLWQHIEDGGASINSQQKYFHKGDDETIAGYSPIMLIPEASERKVACMLMHGTADNQVFFKQAPLFSAALSAAGQKVQEEFYPYYSHGLVGSSDKNAECLSKTIDFIKNNI